MRNTKPELALSMPLPSQPPNYKTNNHIISDVMRSSLKLEFPILSEALQTCLQEIQSSMTLFGQSRNASSQPHSWCLSGPFPLSRTPCHQKSLSYESSHTMTSLPQLHRAPESRITFREWTQWRKGRRASLKHREWTQLRLCKSPSISISEIGRSEIGRRHQWDTWLPLVVPN